MKINDKYLKISYAAISIPKNIDIKIDDEINIVAKAQCIKTEDKSNQNGTISKGFIVRVSDLEIVGE